MLDLIAGNISNVIIAGATIFVVQLLKKIKLPTKIAPVAAVIVALVIVGIGKALGFELDIQTVADAILKAIGLGALSVLGYDITKKLAGK